MDEMDEMDELAMMGGAEDEKESRSGTVRMREEWREVKRRRRSSLLCWTFRPRWLRLLVISVV